MNKFVLIMLAGSILFIPSVLGSEYYAPVNNYLGQVGGASLAPTNPNPPILPDPVPNPFPFVAGNSAPKFGVVGYQTKLRFLYWEKTGFNSLLENGLVSSSEFEEFSVLKKSALRNSLTQFKFVEFKRKLGETTTKWVLPVDNTFSNRVLKE